MSTLWTVHWHHLKAGRGENGPRAVYTLDAMIKPENSVPGCVDFKLCRCHSGREGACLGVAQALKEGVA